MTKSELLKLLENVDDNANIVFVNYIPNWGESVEKIDKVIIENEFNRVILK